MPRLDEYQRKRDFTRTPEPSGAGRGRKRARAPSFVVQKHAATRLHFDFRLELDGVLKSWAVPKGPSLVVAEKRLAVETEDHPLEYARFEGVIPESEYGGGTVMVWDRGTWSAIGDAREGLSKGHLEIELSGERLRGRWSLVRLADRDRRARSPGAKASWLLIKRSDPFETKADGDPAASELTSVASGRTMDEIAAATGRARKVWRSSRPRQRARPEERGGAVALVGGVRVSNPERVIDRASGPRKVELARHYLAVAPLLLEHARDRPLSLVRCPGGIHGQCFFQKRSHPGMDEEIEVSIDPLEQREILSVKSQRGLATLSQWRAVELHGWGARRDALERRDWIVMDLDPAPDLAWAQVVDGARTLRERLRELGLESFVKTTGGKGLHVVIPLERRHGWDVVKGFAHALALDVAARQPGRFVAVMSKRARAGRIFVDYLRNARGSTAVLPYSVRAREGLPVAMPLEWRELGRVEPAEIDIRTAGKWIARRARDPWEGLRARRQRITAAMVDRLEV